jgi:hypothetical protein
MEEMIKFSQNNIQLHFTLTIYFLIKASLPQVLEPLTQISHRPTSRSGVKGAPNPKLPDVQNF